jgi:hypothetical protein
MHPLVLGARLSRAAYWSADGAPDAIDALKRELEALGLTLVGRRDTEAGDRHCFACRDAAQLHIVVAGTKDVHNLAEDLDALPIGWTGRRLRTNELHVHQGFHGGWSALHDWVDAVVLAETAQGCTNVTFSGHSLGAAVASLLAADCAGAATVACITYGCPRVGMVDWVNAYHDAGILTVRCVHDLDGIPCLPPPGVYRHVCGEERLSDDGRILGEPSCFAEAAAAVDGEWLRDHGIEKYIAACEKFAARAVVAA